MKKQDVTLNKLMAAKNGSCLFTGKLPQSTEISIVKMNRLEKSDAFMSAAHRSIDQRRKYSGDPYEVHPRGVRRIVAQFTDDEDTLIAADFHDIIEDVFPKNPAYDVYRIAAEFGDVVAGYVVELTDCYTKEAWPDLNRKKRKQLERERYAKMSPQAKLIKLADICYNIADTVPEDIGFAGMYLYEKQKCLPYLRPTEKDGDLALAISTLWEEAVKILERQKKRLGLK